MSPSAAAARSLARRRNARDPRGGRLRRQLVGASLLPVGTQRALQIELERREANERRNGARTPELRAEALARIEAHRWPGNVRELRSVIERALLLALGSDVDGSHVAAAIGKGIAPRNDLQAVPAAAAPPTAAFSDEQARERQRIVEMLDACAGNQTRAAQRLGISRATLTHKLALFRIPRPRK